LIITPGGAPAAFGTDVAVRTGITEADIGAPLTFRVQDCLDVLNVSGLCIRRTLFVSNPPSPDDGKIVRLICTVSFCAASNPYRIICHPDVPDEILVHCRGRIRRGLRTGDKVIAETLRFSNRLLAIRSVRLAADYLSKIGAHISLMSGPSPLFDTSPRAIS
jgi:hypothetical protein